METPAGIANHVSRKVVEKFRRDGINSLGDYGGVKYNMKPYFDYTGYKPINDPNKDLVDPGRWQPLVYQIYDGIYREQTCLVPQMANMTPISIDSVYSSDYEVPPHGRLNPHLNHDKYDTYKEPMSALI